MRPETEAELAAIITEASGPLSIVGGGTQGRAVAGDRLSTQNLSDISLYEPGALTMVAGAGTPLDEIETELARQGQRLAFEPMDHRGLLGTKGNPTIGGVVAANVSGPRRIQVGACRDFLLGVRFVDGRGQVIKNGGRVMKNVTGYDLVKLMAGSFGTLGVLTEVSFKVMPKPQSQAVLSIEGLTEEAAVSVMSAALGSPFDVSGAAHAANQGRAPVTMIRVEGFDTSVAYRADRLKDQLAKFGAFHIETDPERVSTTWKGVRDVEAFHGRQGDVWRISCKPSDGPQLAVRIGAEGLLYDWGGGLIWALVPDGTDVRAKLGAFEGHATLIRAVPETKARLGVFQPEPAGVAALSMGLKAKFDPRGILNPGLMG